MESIWKMLFKTVFNFFVAQKFTKIWIFQNWYKILAGIWIGGKMPGGNLHWREFAWRDFAWRDFAWRDFELAGNCLAGKWTGGKITGGNLHWRDFFGGNLNRREFELAGKLRHTELLRYIPKHRIIIYFNALELWKIRAIFHTLKKNYVKKCHLYYYNSFFMSKAPL